MVAPITARIGLSALVSVRRENQDCSSSPHELTVRTLSRGPMHAFTPCRRVPESRPSRRVPSCPHGASRTRCRSILRTPSQAPRNLRPAALPPAPSGAPPRRDCSTPRGTAPPRSKPSSAAPPRPSRAPMSAGRHPGIKAASGKQRTGARRAHHDCSDPRPAPRGTDSNAAAGTLPLHLFKSCVLRRVRVHDPCRTDRRKPYQASESSARPSPHSGQPESPFRSYPHFTHCGGPSRGRRIARQPAT